MAGNDIMYLSQQVVQSFLKEVKGLQECQHKRIVQYIDYGSKREGSCTYFYLIMEYMSHVRFLGAHIQWELQYIVTWFVYVSVQMISAIACNRTVKEGYHNIQHYMGKIFKKASKNALFKSRQEC